MSATLDLSKAIGANANPSLTRGPVARLVESPPPAGPGYRLGSAMAIGSGGWLSFLRQTQQFQVEAAAAEKHFLQR